MSQIQEYQIELLVGDITTLPVDAIVNAANKTLLAGLGGVDLAIHSAAGPGLQTECWTLNGCETGEAKITGGHALPAKHIIHTVGPVYTGAEEEPLLLAECYRNSLNLAKENDLHSIAFPAISAGSYGYPAEEAAQITVKAIDAWQKENPSYAIRVIVVCFDEEMLQVYRQAMGLL